MKTTACITVLLTALLLSACIAKREVRLSGKTMGTTYHVKIVTHFFALTGALHKQIADRLEDINQQMSTFLPDSEISRFNAFDGIGEKFGVSDDFFRVMEVANQLYHLSDGAWDGTVMPLVDLWGFGPSAPKRTVPDPGEISACLNSVGFGNIDLVKDKSIIKKESVRLDLASIAKGYAVDQLGAILRLHGYDDFLVEIGGEVLASGVRKDGKLWRVGINLPTKDAHAGDVYRVVSLKGKALATSGDYRNFFEIDGRRYSHVIDPRTGYPVSNGMVSVSVVADNCTFADGLATAIMVLNPENGLVLVNRLPDVQCLIVVQEKDGTLTDYRSKGF